MKSGPRTWLVISAIMLAAVLVWLVIFLLFHRSVVVISWIAVMACFAYVYRWRRPTPVFTDLAPQDLHSPEFRSRLHDAAELDDLALYRIIEDELPHLRNVGVYLDGHFVGFASYATTEAGSELEYIAIDPVMRGKRLGQALIASIPKPIHATTDDDAIGFYQALGFDTEPIAPDPRWPDRQRYSCTLRDSVEPSPALKVQL